METVGERRRSRLYRRLHANPVLAMVTKVVVTIIGTLITIVGVITIVTPGPAIVLVPLGLSILATEWAWAYRLLLFARRKFEEARARELARAPRVRRRRQLLAVVAVVVVVGLIVGYLLTFGWPAYAVRRWDWAQAHARWLPELPGM